MLPCRLPKTKPARLRMMATGRPGVHAGSCWEGLVCPLIADGSLATIHDVGIMPVPAADMHNFA